MNEQELDYLEQQIPELANIAFKQAYWQTLAAGEKVLAVEDGILVEISPDGSRQEIQKLPPHLKVNPGEKIQRHA